MEGYRHTEMHSDNLNDRAAVIQDALDVPRHEDERTRQLISKLACIVFELSCRLKEKHNGV